MNKKNLNARKVIPLLMIALGVLMILFWLPPWIWFILFGTVLIVIGINILG